MRFPRRALKRMGWLALAMVIASVLLLDAYLLHDYHSHSQGAPQRATHKVYPNVVNDDDRQNAVEANDIETVTVAEIPKIIHLMWSDRLVPESKLPYATRWPKLNPDYRIWFWDDASFSKLLKQRYPHLESVYGRLKGHDKIVSRRYFVIHEYGGLYTDLDVEPIRPLNELLAGHSCLLSQEPRLHAKLGWQLDTMIGSAIFACRPKHPYFELVLNLLEVNGKDPHTLAASGSVMLSRVYSRYMDLRPEFDHPLGVIAVAEPDVFMPHAGEAYLTTLEKDCSNEDAWRTMREPFCEKYARLNYRNGKIPVTSFTVHHWFRSWTNRQKDSSSTEQKRDIFQLVPGLTEPKLH